MQMWKAKNASHIRTATTAARNLKAKANDGLQILKFLTQRQGQFRQNLDPMRGAGFCGFAYKEEALFR